MTDRSMCCHQIPAEWVPESSTVFHNWTPVGYSKVYPILSKVWKILMMLMKPKSDQDSRKNCTHLWTVDHRSVQKWSLEMASGEGVTCPTL